MSKVDWVKSQIESHKVVVFSKTSCPFCKMAKKALGQAGLSDFFVIELNGRDDCQEIQDILMKITKQRTVPQVFIAGEFIGGGSETEALQKSGQLVPKLKNAGAL